MGIDIYSAQFLRSEVKRGIKLEHMITLGHQAIYMDSKAYGLLIASLGMSPNESVFADDFFRGLGAKSIDVMDVSAYEGANKLHDLNNPISSDLQEKYDCVFDGGALEHVFNFPQALKSCMEMVKVGGNLIAITPASAFCGHGFYQFSPEMFYNALSDENGYAVERMLFIHQNQWYSVCRPSDIKGRVELQTSKPTLLFISAKRLKRKPIFASWPQQSDYTTVWEDKTNKVNIGGKHDFFKRHLLNLIPWARKLQSWWRNYKTCQKCQPSNQKLFIPVKLD